MKTFQTIINEVGAENVYPALDGLDDAFKNACSMWFASREVSSDQNFVRFFQRIIIRDFGQYKQLLRIEPNIASYDWLVQNYKESMTENTRNSSESTSEGIINTRTDNLANGQTKTITRDHDETITNNLADANTRITTTTHGATVTTTATDTETAGGSDTRTGSNKSDTKQLSKENPMSISYSGGIDISHLTGHTGNLLDWEYPSGQSESASEDESTDTTNYGRTNTRALDSVVSNGGEDEIVDENSGTKTGTVTKATDASDTETISGTNTGTVETVGSVSGTKTGNGTNVMKHIDTGRNIDISTLLNNATSFIINSSAWEWMRRRLEPCFMGIYSDDEVIERGTF